MQQQDGAHASAPTAAALDAFITPPPSPSASRQRGLAPAGQPAGSPVKSSPGGGLHTPGRGQDTELAHVRLRLLESNERASAAAREVSAHVRILKVLCTL